MQNIAEILSGQHGLVGVQEMLTGAAMQAVLTDALQSLLPQPDQLIACRLDRAKLKPGRKLTAYYDLTLRDEQGAAVQFRPIAVTWTPAETGSKPTQEEAYTRVAADLDQRGLTAPFRQLFTSVPAWGMELQVAPLDPRYPQLARMADPRHVDALLGVAGYMITPIRYRPGQRHLLRYDPLTTEVGQRAGQGTLFAKLYALAESDEQGAKLFAQVNRAADWLEAHSPGVTMLRPQAYLPDEATLLYPWVNGTPLSHQFGNPARPLVEWLQQTGAALHTLHNVPVSYFSGLPTHQFATEIKAILRTCEQIQLLLPTMGQTIQALLQRAHERYATLPQEASTLIHGDFKADHLLVRPEQLTLIDFDSCALGDPAFDIGKFLADLDWWYAGDSQTKLAQMKNAFLAGYNLDPADPRLLRAQVWTTLIQIKIAAHRIPLFDRTWAAHTAARIERISANMAY